MTDRYYGEVVRETPAQAHARKVEAIAAVLRQHIPILSPETAHKLAKQCLDALEAGF